MKNLSEIGYYEINEWCGNNNFIFQKKNDLGCYTRIYITADGKLFDKYVLQENKYINMAFTADEIEAVCNWIQGRK